MSFFKKFPLLFQFFAGYFPDSDFDGLSDTDVVAKYVFDNNRSDIFRSQLEKIKEELNDLIANIDFYWQEVGDESNRYFENEKDALEWIIMIKGERNKVSKLSH